MYKNFKAKSLSVLENYNVHLKRYTAYRLHKKQINTDNSYSELTKDMIKECLNPEIQEQLYVTRRVVYGNHKLYIRYFEPFCSDNTIVFTTNGHAIYLYKTEIQHIECNEKSVKIVSDDQTMTIKFV